MKKTLLALITLVSVLPLLAQTDRTVVNGSRTFVPGTYLSVQFPNDATTGTTQFKLATLTSSGAAIIFPHTQTSGVLGIVVDNAGKTGSAEVAEWGQATCTFDGGTTANDYVEPSSTNDGNCVDAGAARPTNNSEIIGKVLSTNASAGNYLVSIRFSNGMNNPMTSTGDIIIGGTGGAPERLAIGTNGNCLTSNGTTAIWGACAAGSGVSLQTNGTANSVQNVLNLENGVGITLTNVSNGNVQFALNSPSLSTIGGVEAINSVAHEWLNSISTAGVPQLSQPNFTDLSGLLADTQLPADSAKFTGTITAGDCVSWSSSGVIQDFGSHCNSSAPFNGLTGGTNNSASMIVGSGASLSTSGTGSIIASTLQGCVNVQTYGAIGNGTTDDTSAINNAIAAAMTNGGCVFFPPTNAKYLVDGEIILPNTAGSPPSQKTLELIGFGDGVDASNTGGLPNGGSQLDLRVSTSAVPATPTVTPTTGTGSLAAGTYYVKITFVDNIAGTQGETLPSAETSAVLSATGEITVTSPAGNGEPYGYNIYIGTTSNGETLQNASPVLLGTNYVQSSALIAGSAVPSSDTTHPPKILTLGKGTLTIADLALTDRGTDCAPFIGTTNTTLYIHRVSFWGTAANTSACNDAILLGSTTSATGAGSTSYSIFQGYGTDITQNFFGNIRRAVWAGSAANSILVDKNTFWLTSGTSLTNEGAISFHCGTGSDACQEDYISGNIFELPNYPSAMYFQNTTNAYIAGNQYWDSSATTQQFIYGDATDGYFLILDVPNNTKPLLNASFPTTYAFISAGTTTTASNLNSNINFHGAATFYGPVSFSGLPTFADNWQLRQVTETTSYTVNTIDQLVMMNSSTAVTATLPSATAGSGNTHCVVQTGAGAVTVQPGAGDTVDGLSFYSLNNQYSDVCVISDGSHDWKIFSASLNGSSASAYETVDNAGTALTQRPVINFSGAAITCADNSGANRTDCTVNTSGTTIDVNGTATTAQTPINFENSAVTDGLTLTFANPSAGNIQLGLTGALTVPGGGTGLATITQYGLPYGNGTSALNVLAPPATNGHYFLAYNVTSGVAVAPVIQQSGITAGSVNGAATTYTFASSDEGSFVVHDKAATGAVTITLPTPTTLGNTNWDGGWCNDSAQTDTLTPTTYTIAVGNSTAAASVSIVPGECLRLLVDPFNSNQWIGIPSWTTVASSFANLTGGTNTTAAMVVGSGSSLVPNGGTVEANQLLFGTTSISTTSTPPVSGQCLEYNGTGITGATCSGAATAPTITVPNAGTTGTTVNTLTKLTGTGTVVVAATTDTGGIVGITTSGAGTTGSATVTYAGLVNCAFDGATTANDYVQNSATTGGDCHDAGAAYPTLGQVIGRVLSTNAASGSYQIDLFPSEIKGAPSSVAFNLLSSGTNTTAAMVVGTGASLSTTGTGTIAANELEFGTTTLSLSATAPTSNQCLQYNGTSIVGFNCISGVALSAITAATASNTISNANNPQTWQWAQTSNNQAAFTLTESTAATGTSDILLKLATLAGSTAEPLAVSDSLSGTQTLCAICVTPTWNTTGVVDAAIFLNVTNTASGTGSLLADFQVGGTSQWKVDSAGNTTQLGGASFGTSPPTVCASVNGCIAMGESAGPSGAAGVDSIFASSAHHRLQMNNNNGVASDVIGGIAATIASRNTAISTSNLVASTSIAGIHRIALYAYDSAAGAGCAGNATITWTIGFTDPTGTSQSQTATETISTATGNGNATGGDPLSQQFVIDAKSATAITYATTYSANGSCTTAPSYAADLRVIY